MNWKELGPVEWRGVVAGYAYRHILIDLQVICSVSTIEGWHWYHVSVSRPDRLPSWDMVTKVANEFLGDRVALHVIPKKKDYINLHRYCLHIWSPVEQSVEHLMPNMNRITLEEGIRKEEIGT